MLKVVLLTPEKAMFGPASIAATSRDGRRIAFAVNVNGLSSLWIRDLDSLTSRTLPDTGGAAYPFWSYDGRFLAFFTNGRLKKIDVNGGPAITLCDAPGGRTGTWNQNDVILFAPGNPGGLYRISATGGSATPVTVLEGSEFIHRAAWFLPDGRHFLYTARGYDRSKNGVYVGDLESKTDSKNRRLVLAAASNAIYASGYLLFMRDRILMAQAFDTGGLKLTGDAIPSPKRLILWKPPTRAGFPHHKLEF